MPKKQAATLLIVLAAIGGAIYYLETNKPGRGASEPVTELPAENMPSTEKAQKFAPAKELVNPSGYINTKPFHLQDLIGKQVILVDFWTYSCINCQRTLPYLNAWQEKYGSRGLTIIGVHTPEFAFEQKPENVQAAVEKFSISYPVVLDNDYATWQAYGNRYWPRKYLIDIDGYIIYDHIGEGNYEETEQKIQSALRERAQRLGNAAPTDTGISHPAATPAPTGNSVSPETYFGAARNEFLGNGQKLTAGPQHFSAAATAQKNKLYLAGDWDIQPEYATNTSPASIVYRYRGQNVYLVAAADQPVTVRVLRDGRSLEGADEEDIQMRGTDSIVTIQPDRLYKLIAEPAPGEHTLELFIESPGLRVYTLTFG